MIKNIWLKIKFIFNKKQKLELTFTLIVIFIGAVLELIGISAIYPFIAIVLDPNAIENNVILNFISVSLNITSTNVFLLVLAIGLICIYFLKNMFLAFSYYVQNKFVYDNQEIVATQLLSAYMKEPYTFFLKQNTAVLLRSINTDVPQFFSLVLNALGLFSSGVLILILFIYLMFTDFLITFTVGVIMAVCSVVFLQIFKFKTTKYGKEAQTSSGKMYQWLNQAFGGVKEIKILKRENYFTDNFSKHYKIYSSVTKKFQITNQVPRLVMETACVVGILAIMVSQLSGNADANAYISKLSVFAVALFRIYPHISECNRYLNVIMFNKVSLDLVYEDLKEAEKLESKKGKVDSGIPLPFNCSVTVQEVTYHYPDSEEHVLDKIQLIIPKGKSIALIGSSGAGKTTLVDLILGILEPSAGKILVDGADIYTNISAWADKLGYIPQNIYLSDDTIRNNVAFGLQIDEGQDELIWKALEQAQLKEFVIGLPNQLNTTIGERGVRLSGGQRQRIGIARALYSNPEILVLDEATSALDNDTEAAVMEAIDSLQGVKTLIIIAHRLSTVKNCDIIYRVEDGKVLPVDS